MSHLSGSIILQNWIESPSHGELYPKNQPTQYTVLQENSVYQEAQVRLGETHLRLGEAQLRLSEAEPILQDWPLVRPGKAHLYPGKLLRLDEAHLRLGETEPKGTGRPCKRNFHIN